MALSQDEQRVLAEIERRLTADDPGLATCLTSFRRPGPATVLRSPRARILGSLFTVLLVAIISLMVYAMIPFRSHTTRITPATTSSGSAAITASGTSDQTRSTPPVSASVSTVASAKSPGKPAAPAAGRSASTLRAQPALGEGAGQPTSPGGGP